MSGQQIGSVVGGVIGAYFGGPYGYAIGSAIGGAIGGAVDPTIIKGPRLTDAMQQTVSDSVPLPWGFGTFPTAGNIIWRGALIEREHEDDGKGSGTVQVTYSYRRSYAISICQGVRQTDGTYLPIAGILQVKRNGKVVYDVTPGVSTEMQAQNAKFLRNATFYLGSEDQLPSSVIEAELGVGDAPAYPGTVYMVVSDDDLTDFQGAIPQYEFVVSVCGSIDTGPSTPTWIITYEEFAGSTIKESSDGIDWSSPGFKPDFGVAGSWNPESSAYLEVGSGEVLAVSVVPGVNGIGVMHRDSGSTTWNIATTEDDLNSSSGKIAFTSYGWLLSGHTPSQTRLMRSQTGLSFEVPGTYSDSAAFIGDWVPFSEQIVGVAQLGAGNVVTFDADGTNPNVVATSVFGDTGSCAIETDGATLLVAMCHGVGNVTLHSASAPDGPWTQRSDDLFPGFNASGLVPKLHYSLDLQKWFCAVGNRVASGGSVTTIAAEGAPLPANVNDMDDDGQKLLACGSNGLLMMWHPETGWQQLVINVSTDILAVKFAGISGEPIPDAPGYYIDQNGEIIGPGGEELTRCKPTVGEVVAEACLRSGMTANDFDVSELTDEIDGYKVAIETSGEAIIGPLMQGWFFDAAEFDDKIRFIKRGGDVVSELTADDLCESDGDVIEETELQEAELLCKVHVKTIDPAAGFTITTQTAERRTSTVKAKGEQTVEVAVVTDKDTQAQIADKKLKVGWAETRRFKTCIPYTRPDLTVTDVIGLTDRKGKRSRVRLMEMSEDSGRISIDEAMLDRQSSYTSNVDGVATQPPTDTSPGLIGPTFGVPMNLPRLTTQDNVPGAYIAACGYLTGWMGCTVLLSADDGVSYQQVATFDQPSSMGVLKADATEGSEPLQVFMRSGSISSVTDSQLASRLNAWAITTGGTSEVGQTKTSVQDSNDIYQLTENVRGALGTLAAAHLEDDPFVMLGSTQFLPLDIGLAGKTLYFKFVSYGTSPDDTEAIPFVFNPQFTGPAVVEPYTDDAGNVYTDDAGNTYFYEGP